MTGSLRHFLRDDDLAPAEQAEVLALAERLKAARAAGEAHERPLASPALGPRPVTVSRGSTGRGW